MKNLTWTGYTNHVLLNRFQYFRMEMQLHIVWVVKFGKIPDTIYFELLLSIIYHGGLRF